MNEPTKNRVSVYEVERFCERLHKLVIEAHPSLGEPKFWLDTGTLRVSFPAFQGVSYEYTPDKTPMAQFPPQTESMTVRVFSDQASPQTPAELVDPKPRKSKKVPQ